MSVAHQVKELNRLIKRAGDESATNSTLSSDVQSTLRNQPSLATMLDSDGFTPLFTASAKEERLPSLSFLLGSLGGKFIDNTTIDAKGEDNETPLYIATFNRNVSGVKALINAGAKVNEFNGARGETALICACRLGWIDVVTALVEQGGANINLRSVEQKETPLFAAAAADRLEVVYYLLAKNATKSIPNFEGKEPLYVASEKKHTHVTLLLKTEVANLRTAKAAVDVEVRHAPQPMFHAIHRRQSIEADRMHNKYNMSDSNININSGAGSPVSPSSATVLNKGGSSSPVGQRAAERTPPLYEKIEPQPTCSIDVPAPPPRTHDPFTGEKLPECKTSLEAGPYRPAVDAPEALEKLEAVRGEDEVIRGTRNRAPIFEIQAGDVDEDVLSRSGVPLGQ